MAQDLGALREPTALLIIRAWIEHGSLMPLRVYIRETDDVSLGFARTSTVVDIDAALEIVRGWLEEVLDAGAPTDVDIGNDTA